MTSLEFIQIVNLRDEKKLTKYVSNPTFRNITRCKDLNQPEYTKKKKNVIHHYT